MAGLIKGQILKHLSKFTKNLSPDKINISTMKGEGDLSNLELDEVALMEVLDLPTWLRLTKAICNRVAIKIQWTKLKTQPICIYLDEIVVEMETCSTPREPTSPTTLANLSSAGKYGFAERIIDGIYMSINSVIVNFKAPAFHASIQLSRILVSSKTPLWQNGDLRVTRIKDDLRGELLIFKEIEWQTLRIEANALEGVHPNMSTTPLRLIANQSKTRITIKKRLSDCSVIASRVQFHLDDLLWVLTDSQLKAAFLFANSLKEVIHKSSLQSKLLAADKIQKQMSFNSGQGPQKTAPKPTSKAQIEIAKLFALHDVVETSYHLYTGRIDLHLCDDSAPGHDDEDVSEEAGYRRKVEGGAMQLTLHKLMVDHYPYHPAGTERIHWVKYDENMMARHTWAQDLLTLFREDVRRVRETVIASTPPPSPERPGQRSQKAAGNKQTPAQRLASQTSITGRSKPTKLLESCIVLRLEDFTIYRVSTANDHKRNLPRKFATSDKKQLLLPPEMSCIHLEYTEYYFPEGIDYPVPSANLYVVVNPIRLTVDFLTIIWLNAFSLNMLANLDLPQTEGPKFHVDTKIDALMPRIILSAESEVKGQSERPDSLQIQASKLSMTNVRIEPKASFSELHHTLKHYECGRLFKATDFPVQDNDLLALPDSFKHHLQRTDHAFLNKAVGDILISKQAPDNTEDLLSPDSMTEALPKGLTYYSMSTDSLKMDALKDVWCLAVDQFWVEFTGVPNSKNRPVPFVESFPLTVWLVMPQMSPPLQAASQSASAPPSQQSSQHSSPRQSISRPDITERYRETYPRDDDFPNYRDGYHRPRRDSRNYEDRSPRDSPHRDSPHRDGPYRDGYRESSYRDGPRPYSPHSPGPYDRRPSPHRDECRSPRDFYEDSRRHGSQSPHRDTYRETHRDTYKDERREKDRQSPRRDNTPQRHRDQERGDCPPRDYDYRSKDTRRLLKQYYSEDDEPSKPQGDMHAIVKIGAKINVEINHFQFLFLMRLMETISKFQAELLDDTNYICKQQDIKVKQMVVALVIPEVEMALVCPPLPEAKPLEEESREDSMDLQEAGLTDREPSQQNLAYYNDMEYREPLPYSNGVDGATPISKSFSDTEIASNDVLAGMQPGPMIGQPMTRYASSSLMPDDRMTSVSGSTSPQDVSPLNRLTSMSTEHMVPRDRKSGDFQKSFKNALTNLSRFSEKVKQNVKKDLLDDDFESMSIISGDSDDEDYAILRLQNQTEAPAFETRRHSVSDTGSVTDTSNDRDDSLSTSSEKARKMVSVVSFRCKNMEAVLQTRGEDINIAATIDNVIPVEYGNINLDKFQAKLATVPGDGSTLQAYINQSQNIVSLLHKYAGNKDEDTSKEEGEITNPPIKLRYMLGPTAQNLVPRGLDLGFLKVIVEDLRLALQMSSITNLTDFIEDEIIPEAMPMLIHNKSCNVTLVKMRELNRELLSGTKTPTMEDSEGEGDESDAPPVYITSPGAVPMQMTVRDLVIWRGQDNIFNISCAEEAVPFGRDVHCIKQTRPRPGPTMNSISAHDAHGVAPLSHDQLVSENSQLRQMLSNMEEEMQKRPKNEWDSQVVKTLEHENDQLRRQLEKIAKLDGHAANEKLQREVEYLREHTPEKLKKENNHLHEEVKKYRDEVQMYKDERESLLTAIRALQDDLEMSERLRNSKTSAH